MSINYRGNKKELFVRLADNLKTLFFQKVESGY